MATTVIFLFHGDDDSLNAGSHVAERIRQVADDQGVELEVYCFGPAQAALTEHDDNKVRVEYSDQIDALVAAGVRVGASHHAANAAGTADTLTTRGVTLEFARDAFVRHTLDGATVISF
ncbi:MAG: hypothetical protein ACK4V6_02095 [Microthrixaceae bacterium]